MMLKLNLKVRNRIRWFYCKAIKPISLAIIYKELMPIYDVELGSNESKSELPFEVRALSALGISVVADALDYIGVPIFALPFIGDIADGIVMTLLYHLTGSKTSTVVNAIEFIPFIGDFVLTYTITTLVWILREYRRRHSWRHHSQIISSPIENCDEHIIRYRRRQS